MKLRIAKKITLARDCGPGCHRWGRIQKAFDRFSKAMRTGRSRLLVPFYPEMKHWTSSDKMACCIFPDVEAHFHYIKEEESFEFGVDVRFVDEHFKWNKVAGRWEKQ